MQKTKIRLAGELAEVCRNYYKEVWANALNLARVLAASEWRSAENIFYPEDICEVPTVLPPPISLALTSFKHSFTTQASLSSPEVSKGPGKIGDQSQEVEATKGKGAG